MSALSLEKQIIRCRKCPRLIRHCQETAKTKRKSYLEDTYWGKPVPGFGDQNPEVLIVGLAPAAHGANRTGRMFTGDRSGEWLYRAVYESGFSNQPESVWKDDPLKIKKVHITSVVKCAPPENKPSREEIQNCSTHLKNELGKFKKIKVFLVLGQIGLNGLWPYVSTEGEKKPKFGHAKEFRLKSGKILILSYHPSQQNTFTKRLTKPMFDQVFKMVKKAIA